MKDLGTQQLWALVPVKPFGGSKGRLAPLLSRGERALLARAMLQDVLFSLTSAPSLAGVTVLTRDPDAAAIAAAAGAGVVEDDCDAGLAASLTNALGRLPAGGDAGVLILPADIPAIRAADVEAIVMSNLARPAVTLVAADDGGTNALGCSPAKAIALQFGPGSFRRHLQAAREWGIAPQVLSLPRVALDIDRPEDVFAFLARQTDTRSHAFLTTLGLESRLRAHSEPSLR